MIIAQQKDLVVHETLNGYEVTHIPTGRTCGMSDGVDSYFKWNSRKLGYKSIPPRTPAWRKACQRDLEKGYRDWLEAYFDIRENA